MKIPIWNYFKNPHSKVMLEKISQKFWKDKEKQQKGDKVFEIFEIAGAKIVAVGVNLYPEDNIVSENSVHNILHILCSTTYM